MPMQRLRHPLPELAPTERLARAISNIDKRLDEAHRGGQPTPLSAHRARRILQNALQRCREPGIAAQADAAGKQQRPNKAPLPRNADFSAWRIPPQDFRGCRPAEMRTDLPPREVHRELHAYEGKSMAYDWTGEATRKRTRLKLASALLLSLAILVAIPAAIVPFL